MKTIHAVVWLITLLYAPIVDAQRLPRKFVELSTHIGFGKNTSQWNGYYGGNFKIHNHGRFYFTVGTRLGMTYSKRSFDFTTPQPSAPVISFNDNGVWISSLNLAFGISCAVTENLYASFNSEVLGISTMSQLEGSITNKGNAAEFNSVTASTNIILNPSNVGNLQNQLMLSYRVHDQLFLSTAFATQRSQVDFTSSSNEYGAFSLSDRACFFFAGIQWRYVCTKKAH